MICPKVVCIDTFEPKKTNLSFEKKYTLLKLGNGPVNVNQKMAVFGFETQNFSLV